VAQPDDVDAYSALIRGIPKALDSLDSQQRDQIREFNGFMDQYDPLKT
jgi:hypothetical protein